MKAIHAVNFAPLPSQQFVSDIPNLLKCMAHPFCSICAPLEKCQRTAMGHRVLSPEQMESTNTLLPLK